MKGGGLNRSLTRSTLWRGRRIFMDFRRFHDQRISEESIHRICRLGWLGWLAGLLAGCWLLAAAWEGDGIFKEFMDFNKIS